MMETYHGYVRTPADAIKLFEACRLGLLPRVQRRLSEKERQAIRSGSVYVWDEREAGMRRWTDGKSWSASRVAGSFLTYREMEGKRGNGFGTSRLGSGISRTPDSGRVSDEDLDDGEPDGYRYKADGLMKQSFSITTSTGQHLHLISYYARPQPGEPELQQPSTDPTLRSIVPVKGMYPESSLQDVPGVPPPRPSRTPPYAHPPPQHQPPKAPPPHPQHPPLHHQAPHHPPPPHPYPPPQYHPQYVHPGYSWPPSPVATPPYSHYTVASYPPPHLPPPHAGHYGPPHHQAPYYPYPSPAQPYDRTAPPPPQAAATQPRTGGPPPAPYSNSEAPDSGPHLSQPRTSALESPRSQQLQAQAAHALIDPRLATSTAANARNAQDPAPATQQVNPATTAPLRHSSVTPPRSSHSELNGGSSANKASLSALLHPTPSNSEPSSAHTASNGANSANSSPRAGAGPTSSNSSNSAQQQQATGQKRMAYEDARAIHVLDKKFCV